MAQLKDTIIFGDLEVTGKLRVNENNINIENIPNSLNVHGILNVGAFECDNVKIFDNKIFADELTGEIIKGTEIISNSITSENLVINSECTISGDLNVEGNSNTEGELREKGSRVYTLNTLEIYYDEELDCLIINNNLN